MGIIAFLVWLWEVSQVAMQCLVKREAWAMVTSFSIFFSFLFCMCMYVCPCPCMWAHAPCMCVKARGWHHVPSLIFLNLFLRQHLTYLRLSSNPPAARLTLKFWCSYLCRTSPRITDVCLHAWFMSCWRQSPGLPACLKSVLPTESQPQPALHL